MRLFFYFINILILSTFLFAQQNELDKLKQRYIAFEYEEVIDLAERLLQFNNFSEEELIQIYEMKGISHFSIGEEKPAKQAFEDLLNLDIDHTMSPDEVSPKIISFFNNVKADYLAEVEDEKPLQDSLKIYRQQLLTAHRNYKSAVVKNLILPGWGQFKMDNEAKGFIYSILGITTAAASVYYIIDTNKKEGEYLNEIDRDLIAGKYDSFNSSYKKRNLFIAAAAAVWLASQIDMIFFTEISENPGSEVSFSPQRFQNDFRLNFSFPLN